MGYSEKITKTEFYREVAKRSELTQVEAGKVLDIAFELIKEHLIDNKRVGIRDFGTFESVLSKRNVMDFSKKKHFFQEVYRVKFRPSKDLNDKLNDKKD